MNVEVLSEAIRGLYAIIDGLEDECSKYPCHFTLDGNLLGSIGEVYAAERYNLELFEAAHKAHDARTLDGTDRLVQIKITQKRTVNKVVGISHKPDCLLVLEVDDDGSFEEVYNGPGSPVWDLLKGKNKPANGQYQISLSKLREKSGTVKNEDRIPAAVFSCVGIE